MSNLEEFKLFPKLPAELKAKIWDFASQEPHRIFFDSYQPRKRRFSKAWAKEPASERDQIFSGRHADYPYIDRLCAEARVPAVLITCRESRYWAMKHYSLCFKDQLYHKALWFNPKVDILVFKHVLNLNLFVRGGCQNGRSSEPIPIIQSSATIPVVERIVIRDLNHPVYYDLLVEMAKSFPHLKSLILRNDVTLLVVDPTSTAYLTQITSLRTLLKELWDSDEWEAIRAHDETPRVQIMSGLKLWNTVR